MKLGETIFSDNSHDTYTIVETFKGGGQAEVAFAQSQNAKRVVFIKRLLNIKYSDKTKDDCNIFEKGRRKIYQQIKKKLLEGSSCTIVKDFFREKSFYYIVTDRIVGITFNPQTCYEYMTIQERLDLFKIITASFLPLEEAAIIHGDVKPQNILLKKVYNHYVSKLIDMESAFFITMPPEKGEIVGTDPYSSPEIINYNCEDNGVDKSVLSTKCDVFSLGIILYELVCGYYPKTSSEGLYAFEIVQKCMRFAFPQYISKELKQLILDMLNIDAGSRPSILQILSRLQQVKDISKPLDKVDSPQIVVERLSLEESFIHLFVLAAGSSISYSIDGEAERKYTGPIKMTEDNVPIKVQATKINADSMLIYSSVVSDLLSVSSEFNGQVSRPVITIEDGIVTLACDTAGADIYYTTDGSYPSRKSTKYGEPISLPTHTIVKAIAIKRGMLVSDVLSRNTSSLLTMSK